MSDRSRRTRLSTRQLYREWVDAKEVARKGNPPTKRSHCDQVARPCPFVGCRHHLFLHLGPTGSIAFPHGDDPAALAHMSETCSLDAAHDGPSPLEKCAQMLNITRQRTQQIEAEALKKLRAYLSQKALEWDTGDCVESNTDTGRPSLVLENTAPAKHEEQQWHSDLMSILSEETH